MSDDFEVDLDGFPATDPEREALEHELQTARLEASWREAELRALRRQPRRTRTPGFGEWLRRLFASPARAR